jgi:hypothetical protein
LGLGAPAYRRPGMQVFILNRIRLLALTWKIPDARNCCSHTRWPLGGCAPVCFHSRWLHPFVAGFRARDSAVAGDPGIPCSLMLVCDVTPGSTPADWGLSRVKGPGHASNATAGGRQQNRRVEIIIENPAESGEGPTRQLSPAERALPGVRQRTDTPGATRALYARSCLQCRSAATGRN